MNRQIEEALSLDSYKEIPILKHSREEERRSVKLIYGEQGYDFYLTCQIWSTLVEKEYVNQIFSASGCPLVNIDVVVDGESVISDKRAFRVNTLTRFSSYVIDENLNGMTYGTIHIYEDEGADMPTVVLLRHDSGIYLPVYGQDFIEATGVARVECGLTN